MLGYVYIKYSDIVGRRPHLNTLKKTLRQLKLSSTLFALTRINTLLGRQKIMDEGPSAMRDLQSLLVTNYIDDILRAEIETAIRRFRNAASAPSQFAVFTRQQILNLLRLAILVCKEESSVLVDGQTVGAYQLGQSCVMMNDHLLTPREERAINEGGVTKRSKHIALQLAPIMELYNPLDLQRAVVRAETLFSDLLHSPEMLAIAKHQLHGLDISQAFFDATGITLNRYREIVLVMLTPILGHSQEQLIGSQNLTLFQRARMIRDTKLQPEEFESYLSLDCISVREAKKRFASKKGKILPHFNYVLFRTKPLLELDNGTIFWTDPCFLLEKLGAGIYWTIVDSLRGSQKDTALTAFGYLFEIYINGILSRLSPKNGTLLASPKYQNGDNAFDSMFFRADQLIVLEYKASFMKIEAKYSGKIKLFENELDKKFGVNKGVIQLAKHIQRLFPHDGSKRDAIPALDLITQQSKRSIRKITPVLIVQEPILRFHGVEHLLDQRLRRLLKKQLVSRNIEIAPLAVFDVDTLEQMKPALVAGDFTLEQCLRARAAKDPDYKQFWLDFLNLSFPGLLRRDPELEQKFSAILDRTRISVFGPGR